MTSNDSFHYFSEKFADLQILRYRVPGFESLPRARKELIYYLYEAALSGRDIIWDQNYRHNLRIRQTLEAIITGYPGDRKNPGFRRVHGLCQKSLVFKRHPSPLQFPPKHAA